MSIPFSGINSRWTLFLDRDGVINQEKKGDYVRNTDEFVLLEGALEGIRDLSGIFGRIIVVTNQRGIGRGLMTESDLLCIHDHMLRQIEDAGGRIDKIYFCPEVSDTCEDRKPNPGMAYRAAADFPAIELSKSIMAGDKLSDMKFGRNAGMNTVLITTEISAAAAAGLADAIYPSLSDFADRILLRSNGLPAV
jgi:D-glycero-D-manno-heptose 1,7-bisphosphate phosphatase